MIRIVGVQRSPILEEEFVLLQNQGGLRINLRGHLVVADSALNEGRLDHAAHAFGDEALIPAGAYVLLHTGCGEPRWARTKDFAYIYHAYANRLTSLWEHAQGPLHVLATQHTFSERKEAIMLR